MKTQYCPGCRRDLDQAEFYACNWESPGNPCKTCARKRAKAGRKKHPGRYKEGKAHSHRRTKYGLSQGEFRRLLDRQYNRCLGCQRELELKSHTSTSACVDHNHITGKIRGILCKQCNVVLGSVHEDKATLRRLMAYLDYDRTKVNIYLAGPLGSTRVREVAQTLREANYEVIDEWHSVGPHADQHWQEYEQERGRTYIDALAGRAAQNTFYFDLVHIDLADALVLVMPAGKSTHLELGYAMGAGKLGFILLDGEPDKYEVMPNFATAVCRNTDELLSAIKKEVPSV